MPVENPEFYGLAAVIAVLVWFRLQASSKYFQPTMRFWYPIRRYGLLPLDKVLEQVPYLYAKTTVHEREYVDTLHDIELEGILKSLEEAGVEVQPLSSVAKNWQGNIELASLALYYGDKPKYIPEPIRSALPEWLRKYQLHVRPFEGGAGGIMITAHCEYNPWRPLWALPHFLGVGLKPCAERCRGLLERAGLIS